MLESCAEKAHCRTYGLAAGQETGKVLTDEDIAFCGELVRIERSLGEMESSCSKIVMCLEAGRLKFNNHRAKRAISPLVVCRRGWLFCNAQRGAQASAVISGIVETAKENGLNPYTYLEYLFEEMPNMDIADPQQLERLFPWSKELPARCRSKKQI